MEDVRVQGLGGLVTVSQAARLLGLTVSGVHKLIRRKELPVVRVGTTILVSLAVLQANR